MCTIWDRASERGGGCVASIVLGAVHHCVFRGLWIQIFWCDVCIVVCTGGKGRGVLAEKKRWADQVDHT